MFEVVEYRSLSSKGCEFFQSLHKFCHPNPATFVDFNRELIKSVGKNTKINWTKGHIIQTGNSASTGDIFRLLATSTGINLFVFKQHKLASKIVFLIISLFNYLNKIDNS